MAYSVGQIWINWTFTGVQNRINFLKRQDITPIHNLEKKKEKRAKT